MQKGCEERILSLFLHHKNNDMLGIDSKREIITGEFARRIWSDVLAMWHHDKTDQTKEDTQKYEVEWV